MSHLVPPSRLQRYFLPYQMRWIRDGSAISIAEKSRRIGWTYASAFRAVERRVILRTDLFYTSTDLTAAREFIEDCCRWARIFQVAAEDLGERAIDESEINAFVLRFENGARIVAGSSNPRFFRGKGGDADADEFAFHQQPRELYKAMQPSSLMWGHQLRLWSTHNGAGSFFHRLVQAAKGKLAASASSGPATPVHEDSSNSEDSLSADADDAVPMTNQRMTHHRVTLLQAVDQGLVERIRNTTEVDLTARRDFVESIRASCADEASFREEYLCEPGAEGSALLSYAAIAGCEAPELRLLDVAELSAAVAAQRAPDAAALYAGFDVGRRQDRSVLWVVQRVGDVLWTRSLHVMGDAAFSAQEQMIDRLLQSRRLKRLCIDSTGIGLMLAERLRQKHHERVEPIHFTAAVKSELAMPLVRLFQERLVRVPADADVREDLHKVRRLVTAAHHVRLDAPRDADGHADRFWALALACHAAEQAHSPDPPSIARKPVGW